MRMIGGIPYDDGSMNLNRFNRMARCSPSRPDHRDGSLRPRLPPGPGRESRPETRIMIMMVSGCPASQGDRRGPAGGPGPERIRQPV